MEDTHILFSGRVTKREGGGVKHPELLHRNTQKKYPDRPPPHWTSVVHNFLSLFPLILSLSGSTTLKPITFFRHPFIRIRVLNILYGMSVKCVSI